MSGIQTHNVTQIIWKFCAVYDFPTLACVPVQTIYVDIVEMLKFCLMDWMCYVRFSWGSPYLLHRVEFKKRHYIAI